MVDTIVAVELLRRHCCSWKDPPTSIKMRGRGSCRDRAQKMQSTRKVLSSLRRAFRHRWCSLLPLLVLVDGNSAPIRRFYNSSLGSAAIPISCNMMEPPMHKSISRNSLSFQRR
ncbi:hypothetical protein PIB30_016535 [Stylosanthes scabra]|uniref:Uncharacterized protein n=1 Tax=Stylosanthes scabra TaxID=79078 RepID=A0ABU6Q8C0_9FABA|nr:hypothetical protein [Stylosanthes scabra]